jgi:hypothetical protein
MELERGITPEQAAQVEALSMLSCDVVLKVFESLTPDQQHDLSLFQKTFFNDNNEHNDQYYPNKGYGGQYKDHSNWLIFDRNCIVGIGKWGKWQTPSRDWVEQTLHEISPIFWNELEPFHHRILSIKKGALDPFELVLKSGLTIFVAPKI